MILKNNMTILVLMMFLIFSPKASFSKNINNYTYQPSDAVFNLINGKPSHIINKKIRKKINFFLTGARHIDIKNIFEIRRYTYRLKSKKNLILEVVRKQNEWAVSNIFLNNKKINVRSLKINTLPLNEEAIDFKEFVTYFLNEEQKKRDGIYRILERNSSIKNILVTKNNKTKNIILNLKNTPRKKNKKGWVVVNINQDNNHINTPGINLENITSIDITHLDPYPQIRTRPPEQQPFKGAIVNKISCDNKKRNKFIRVKFYIDNKNTKDHQLILKGSKVLLEGSIGNRDIRKILQINNCKNIGLEQDKNFIFVNIGGLGNDLQKKANFAYSRDGNPYIDFYY